MQAIRSLQRAHVALVTCDCEVGIADQEARLSSMVQESGRGLVVLLNKWDLVKTEEHRKKLKEAAEPLELFLSRARRLRKHLGPILYQLPPRWKRNVERLRLFCELLPDDLTHVFEFRDRDWLAEPIYEVLEQYRTCLCIHDLLDGHPRRVTGPAVYVRFHGSGQRYGGSYPRDQLHRWADWLCEAASSGREVFAYFNNDAEGHAVRDAMTLRELSGVCGS